jgi:hypothetical protein
MSIGDFFRDTLHAPLGNTRWSWGAVNPKTGQLFLRVWVDERETVSGVDQIHVLGTDWSSRSPGYPERQRQVELLRAGTEGYGVLCVAENPATRGARKIKEFDQQTLLRFGPLIERGGDVYATINGTVSADAVTQPLPRAVVRDILENLTVDDVRGALRRLRDGAPHSFGPSISWDVVYEGRRYPPKAVLGLAAERLAGRPLGPRDFQSGPNKDGFRALERLGFQPVAKNDEDGSQDDEDETAEQEVLRRTDIGETEKERLVKARRGQGIYRENLRTVEKQCRLTGLREPEHLRASHIKPWRECADKEKLDGFNGLLLSPHVDHLFDRGYISFSDDGTVLIAKGLKTEVLERWGLRSVQKTAAFRIEQQKYLDYHRTKVFRGR